MGIVTFGNMEHKAESKFEESYELGQSHENEEISTIPQILNIESAIVKASPESTNQIDEPFDNQLEAKTSQKRARFGPEDRRVNSDADVEIRRLEIEAAERREIREAEERRDKEIREAEERQKVREAEERREVRELERLRLIGPKEHAGSKRLEEEQNNIEPATFSRITECSASTIANSKRNLYDVFTPPCVYGTFIPNERLRQLSASLESLSKTSNIAVYGASFLKNNFLMQQAVPYPAGGGETKVNDPNLQVYCNYVLSRANALIGQSSSSSGGDGLTFTLKKNSTGWNFNFVLACDNSNPEYFIQAIQTRCVVIGSEAKGVEHSHLESLPQVLQLCGDSALFLRRRGLAIDECVVPGIVVVGETFQIVGVYLMPAHFPVLVNVSPPISLTETLMLAVWAEALAMFACETLSLVTRCGTVDDFIQINELQLSASSFFKPIRLDAKLTEECSSISSQDSSTNPNSVSKQRVVLNHIMRIYQKLYQTSPEKATAVIQFPLGIITVPSSTNAHASSIRHAIERCTKRHFKNMSYRFQSLTYTPCLVLQNLSYDDSDDLPGRCYRWKNERPRQEYVGPYLAQFARLIDLLNAAGVVHMDLRPQNVMWKALANGSVQIQAIDFEEALFVGELVPADTVKMHKKDFRYPIAFEPSVNDAYGADQNVFAKTAYNDFFFDNISAWLTQSANDIGFNQFMEMTKGELISRVIMRY